MNNSTTTPKTFPAWKMPAEPARNVDDIQADVKARTPATASLVKHLLDHCDKLEATYDPRNPSL